MSTSITHHPAPYAVVVALFAAIAAVAVVLSLAGSPDSTIVPTGTNVPTSHHGVWHPTTTGGRVMLGQ
jgi:hypothetical protein